VVALVLAASPVSAAVDPAVVGRWQADLFGVPVALEVAADGRCAVAEEPGRCSTSGHSLVFKGEQTVVYQWSAANGALQLSGGDIQAPLAFRRLGAITAAPRAQTEPNAAEAPPSAPGKAVAQGGARGTLDKESWGVTLSLPGGWKSAEKDGFLVAGSDTEAGLILIRYLPKTSRGEMLTQYRAGINEQGFAARPVAEAADFDAPGGPAVAGVLEGVGADGKTVRVRTVGVLSRFGGAVVVTGLTTSAQYPTLAARTDAIARSIAFRAPPRTAPIAGHYEFVYVSRSGGYSREAKIVLCQSGRFTRSGEMAGSGAAGSAVTANRNGGTWQAVGDASAGTLTLTWADGTTSTLRYEASQNPKDRSAYGPALRIGDTLYQKTGSGGC
jgi:hypothetical protein